MKSEIDTALSNSNEYLFSVAPTGFAVKGLPAFSTEMPSPSVGRYWRTLKHLRVSQIYYLLRHRVLVQKDILRWPEAKAAIRRWDGLPRIQEWQPELARQIIEAGHVQF